jgi:sugar phosphate isomerase/epimerase
MTNQTSRRNFLGAAAGVAGLAAAGVDTASAVVEHAPWGIKLGVATYSLRSFDRPKAIELIKALKVQWVSIKDIHASQKGTPAEWQAMRKEFEDAGLKIMSGGNVDMSKDTSIDDMRKHFEYAKHMGMPMMVCAPTKETLPWAEAMAKEYNIRLAIHNHGPGDKHFPTPQSVIDAVKSLDKRVGLCMDVGHTARIGVDPVKAIPLAGDRLFDKHVKDLKDFSTNGQQVDVGDGAMPFPALFKELKKLNYQGCVNLEYEINAKDPMPGMYRSYSYLRGVLAGLAG